MSIPRRRIPTPAALTIGLALGWFLAGHRPPVARAVGGDRFGDYSLTTGPIQVQYNERTKTQGSQEAIYYLDWSGGRLVAMVPVQRQSTGGSQMIDSFIERDLAADFKLDVERGPNPHFLMTPGSLGAYGDGCAPLFVFETTTKKVGVYKLQIQQIGLKSSSKLDLLEMKTYAALPALPEAAR